MLALQRAKHVDYMVNNSHRKNRVGVGGAGVAGVSTVSTQADIAHTATSYESDDESSSRRKQRATNMYSKQEFREQYCINPKQLDLLELEKSKKDRFLGCLSQYHIESPCSRANRSSFLSVCVRRRVPSDENLNTDYAPIQRYPRFGQPTAAPPELYAYDAELESSYFRRRPRSVCSQPDPKKYTWMPEDEDFTRMEWPPSMMDEGQGWPQHYTMDQISSITRGGSLPRPPSIIPCPAHTPLPPPPPPPAPPHVIPPHRPKHVSFARSHTLTTFDDSAMPATLGGSGRFRRECSERLLDGRTQLQAEQQFGYPVMLQPTFPPHVTYFPPAPVHYPPHIAHAPSPLPHPAPAPQLPQPAPRTHPPQETNQSKPLLDSVKKGVMRTQATQTEVSLGRKAHPTYLSLSPRTIKRVTMVAAGVQTNGFTSGPRRLTKSFSEVGGDRLLDRDQTGIDTCGIITDGFTIDHEKLHRTQSEEPPRSPRSPSALNSPVLQREDSDDITDFSPVKSGASFDKSSDISILQRQAQEYFHQNFQFIHESDRDDTVDDEVVDMETLEKSMALNRKNLEFLQQKIAEQARGERSIKSILSKTTSDASQRTISSNPLSKHSTFQSEPSTETSATTTDDSERNEREIMIDFKPRLDDEAVANSKRASKRLLQKTLSEGEILLDARKSEIQGTSADGIKDAPIIMSTSQENMTKEDKEQEGRYKHYITQNYAQTPIKDEGIFSLEPNGSFSSSDGNAPYEDFHEKYISYKHDAFRKRSVSLEEPNETDLRKYNDSVDDGTAKSSPASPSAEDIRDDNVTSRQGILTTRIGLAPLEPTSPFASSESLTVDPSRDHSDGMWNESQATVLQVDSGTENGTVISSSDLSSLATSPGALALLTPTSRRKQLLILQHQQRSSMDTDALDEEFDASQSQSPTSPRMKLDTPGTAAARTSLSPPAVIQLTQPPITKQPHIIKNGSPVGAPKSNHTPAIAITHPSLDLTDVPMRRTPSVINKKRERALSPSRRKDLQRKAQQKYEPNATIVNKVLESSPDPNGKHTNGDPNLARTDSGKTNTTDVSESTTTTTDDYVTANSDSSKKSGTKVTNQNPENNKAQEGSSFESASSLYSSTRTENMCEDFIVQSFSPPLHINEDLIVPSFSPPQQLAEKLNKCSVELIQVKADIVQPPKQVNKERRDKTDLAKPAVDNIKPKDTNDLLSGKSSSSGSYSLTGSNPNFAEETKKEKTEEKKETKLKTTTPEAKSKRQPIASSPEEREQTVPVMKGSVSDDERSGHYSSSGYYESPVEDDDDDGGLTYKHSQKYRTSARPWTTEEKRRKKKAFTLEFSKSYDDSVSTSQDDFSRKSSKNDEATSPYRPERSASKANGRIYIDDKITRANKMFKAHYTEKCKSVQSSPRDHIDIDKVIKEKDTETKRQTERERHVKRTKLKTKSPVQNKLGENNTPGHSRAQFLESQRRGDGIGPSTKLHLNIPTSDDSSEQYKKDGVNGGGNISPRKYRRLRDSPRRKSNACANSARSPTSVNAHTGHRTRRKSGSNESISLPGSLPRRKPSMPVVTAGLSSLEAEDIETSRTLASAGSRLTPLRYIRSPIMSPRPHRKHEKDKESKCAKAASAESLRSVSPGSDSVFYSEQADASAVDADGEAKAHCLHCGKEVHIVTASHDHDSRITSASTSHTHESFTDGTPDIVPAPAGFADSPANGGGSSGGGSSTSKRSASGARLYKKLDKRYRSEDKSRHHHRHRQEVRAKSEERGKEEYATTERREPRIARSAGTSLDKIGGSSGSVDPDEVEEVSGSSAEGTVSGKKDESGVYAAPWWCGNWILVPSQDDVWTRLPPADLVSGDSSDRSWSEEATESETEFSKKYLALTHRLVHRRACIHMYKRQAESGFESDKTVVVRRGNEEFGFRIHGSKPVVVSAIEPDTPAETSGLEVGDIIIAVNGINVLDKSHSEVVKIAHAGSEILELEVARTCEAVASLAHEGGAAALYSGYLWRAAPSPGRAPHHLRWTRRWFVLKRDNCLYYYKTDSSTHPVGALMLINYQLVEEDVGKVHGFRLQRGGGARLQLAADSAEASARWRAVLAHAIDASSQRDGWLEVSMRNMKLPPSSVPRPDCFGYVYKLDSKWKHWSKRYCVLKDACLYFYSDGNSKSAFGMACLHGYRVQQCSPGGRKFAFEVMPAEPKQRHFYFHTESEMDKKRWMAALEYSIDRWMKAG